LNILYIGANYGTSKHRYLALQRLGHDVFMVDPFDYIPSNKWVGKWVYETGAWGFAGRVRKNVLESIKEKEFDFCFVDGGYVVDSNLVRELKQKCKHVVNFNVDDPYPKIGWRKWRLYRESIPAYDLLVVVRTQNINEVKLSGAKKVLHVFRMADEIAHKPVELTPSDQASWASDVCFVGTWMPGRGSFMARLIERGVPLSIWGDRWHNAKEWQLIKTAWRGPGIYTKDYIKPILASKICLGLLSKGNRDLHTQRSAEAPALGSLFCAERTADHLQMYEEDKEAIFWEDADECAEKCLRLLKQPKLCKQIATSGQERCLKNNYFNKPTLKKIIEYALT
jgi:spore maturation protein CgeB